MISIIIPIYNAHEMTQECIEAVRLNTQDYELILIDNGSIPPIEKPYAGFTDVTLIRNEVNLGFPAAVNQGIREAKGDVICLLNNDVIVTPDSINTLAALLDEYAIIGPTTGYCAGVQKVQTPIYNNLDELNEVAKQAGDDFAGIIDEVSFVTGFLMLFPKALFEEIGDFDESMWPCSGEEIDFCYDKETQVVTKNGIKYFYDLTIEDDILTRNDDGIIEYQKPTEIISRQEETLLHFCSKSVDIKCSKKQHLLVGYERKPWTYKNGSVKEVDFILAEEINGKLWKNQSRYYIENASGVWVGEPSEYITVAGRKFDSKTYVEFMAWFLSEGSVCCDKNKRMERRDNQVIISQFDDKKLTSIYETVKKIGIPINKRKDAVSFSDKQLCDYLSMFGKSWDKYIPEEIKKMPPQMLNLFLETYASGDGNRSKNGDRITWYTSSDKMKDDLIELLIKTQRPFTIGLYGGGKMKFKNGVYNCRPVWSIQSCFGTAVNGRGRVSLKKAKEVPYNDITYDVRVPNKRIYIIRNGKGAWSSNCFRAKQAGHRIGVARGVYVHHEGSQTFRQMQDDKQIDYGKICQDCDKHLVDKWGADFWQKQTRIYVFDTAKRINLGCGYRHKEGYINIDNRAEVKPDLLADVLEGLPFDDNSLDEVRAHDFLEHIPIGQTIQVITEIWRVLKPGGVFESMTPSTDGRGAFADPTHVSFWNRNSWLYYSNKEHRDLYGIKANFTITDIEDVVTNKNLNIIHTHVVGKAVKE